MRGDCKASGRIILDFSQIYSGREMAMAAARRSALWPVNFSPAASATFRDARHLRIGFTIRARASPELRW
jgi:hypothetical protein